MKKKSKKTILKKIIWHFKEFWKLTALLFGLTACGVTKATISKPAEGTSTTITISTNNPMTTNVSPDINLKGDK